jgi:glucose/arabinose dehydrogenase
MTLGSKQLGWLMAMTMVVVAGCTSTPVMLKPEQRLTVDRSVVEYPPSTELKPLVRGLTAPVGVAFDSDGTMFVAESGEGGNAPRIVGFKPDGTLFDIYPLKTRLPFNLGGDKFKIYAPIGGLAVYQGRIFVTHRDEHGNGVVTSFGYDGSHYTVVSDLPAQGDYSLTDIIVNPTNGRLVFGLGSATNSGVVGTDNYEEGWVRNYPQFCDKPWDGGKKNAYLKLLGYRFSTPNPRAGIGQDDVLVTGPMQPLGTSNHSRVKEVDKPTGAIYSISPTGGDLTVEAHGIRLPRGLGFNIYRLYATNDGMELRGTRPIRDDPDAMIRVVSRTWYGFPDYSTDFQPITDPRFQPPSWMTLPTGYPDVAFTIDHDSSGLIAPDRSTLLQGTFSPLSGAAKFDFVPASGPFSEYRGNAVVALSGDRAPFATSGQKLIGPIGFKIVLLDVDAKQTREFIHNTKEVPASMMDEHVEALERPIDCKFGPDGALYIVDFGKMELRDGKERITRGSGKIFKLIAKPEPETP